MEKPTRRGVLSASGGVLGGAMLGLPLAGPAETQSEKGKARLKIVVVGGHPDDPESGCGGAMAMYASLGHDVTALYLTRGETGIRGKSKDETASIRTREAIKACEILGARPLFAGQVNGSTEVNAARYQEFQELLAAREPELVLVHWPIDSHRDHRVASLLVYDAWQAARRQFSLFYFEVMTGTQTQNFAPTHYVDITATEKKKRDACYAHQSQNPEDFYSHHDLMNRFRGRECGVSFAEAFVRHAGNRAGLFDAHS